MSSNMSGGQILGAVGGAAIGFFVGGPTGALYGAQIGMAAGGLIDPPSGPTIEGPRLKELGVMASTYGAAIPLVYGQQNRISGNVIWSTGLIERRKKKKSGGKGGGGGSTTAEYSYSVSFAISVGAGQFLGVKRVWANSKLIFDAANQTPAPAYDPVNGMVYPIGGAHVVAQSVTFYPGSMTQTPSPVIEQSLGVGEVPAYRGIGYLVFDRLELADFGNRLPNIEVELDAGGATVAAVAHDICRRAGVHNVSVAGIHQPLRGYVIASSGTAGGALSQLASAFYFDVAEQAGQVRMVKRGRGMKGTIRTTDMGAVEAGENRIPPIDFQTVTELEMPREVSVKYADPEIDYQVNAQRAMRDKGNAQNNITQDFAVTLTASEAAQIADRLLWENWTARRTANYRVSDTWARVAPGDLLGIEVDGQVIPHKLLRVTRGNNGVIDVQAQRDDPAVYESTADGVAATVPANVVQYPGVTRLVNIDGPILRDADDDTGFYWAATGASSGWRGANLLRSSDGGASYSEMSPVALRSTIGTVAAALPAGPADIWDRENTVTVVLDFDDDQLESLDELAVLNGNNAFWLGNPNGQGGEIIQFATATLVAPATYQLSNLLRGRLGTEANVGAHGANEAFVLIDASVNGRSDYGPSEWDKSRLYKPVSVLTDEADTAAQAFTNTGAGKRPYSPVHVAGVRDSSSNLSISWVRRTRLRVPGLGAGPVPIGEEIEAYEIDVYSGSTVVRTISASAPAATYTAAEQTADGLTPGAAVSIRVYQMSAVRGRGFPAIAVV